jgi:hypothetical protein
MATRSVVSSSSSESLIVVHSVTIPTPSCGPASSTSLWRPLFEQASYSFDGSAIAVRNAPFTASARSSLTFCVVPVRVTTMAYCIIGVTISAPISTNAIAMTRAEPSSFVARLRRRCSDAHFKAHRLDAGDGLVGGDRRG